MGQYYNATILKKNRLTVKSWMYSHDYHNGLKLMEHSYIGNNFVDTFENQLILNPQHVVWAGDYADNCKNRKSNISDRCREKNLIKPTEVNVDHERYRFIVNHSKKQFVDKRSVPEITHWEGTRIHPLPLLTCEGNGRGGGDFRGDEKNIVGSWARDLISIESELPSPNYKQLKFDLKE